MADEYLVAALLKSVNIYFGSRRNNMRFFFTKDESRNKKFKSDTLVHSNKKTPIIQREKNYSFSFFNLICKNAIIKWTFRFGE